MTTDQGEGSVEAGVGEGEVPLLTARRSQREEAVPTLVVAVVVCRKTQTPVAATMLLSVGAVETEHSVGEVGVGEEDEATANQSETLVTWMQVCLFWIDPWSFAN